MNRRARLLIVEPDRSLRQMAAQVLCASGCALAGTTGDAFEAVRIASAERPDVILLPVLMGGMDGVEVTEQIMASAPTAVVLWSAYRSAAEVRRASEGLRAGALEVCARPSGDDDVLWQALVATVLAAARVGVRKPSPANPGSFAASWPVVVIGASTGGPRALRKILSGLPADFPAPIVAALHGAGAAWNDSLTWLEAAFPLEVCTITDNTLIDPGAGRVWVAPPGFDVAWRGQRLYLRVPADRGAAAPNIDRLFRSTAITHGPRAIGILLTGLGSDGARGLAAIRARGGRTLVQSTASAMASSMPAAALAWNAAEHEVDLERIPTLLMSMLATGDPAQQDRSAL